MTHGRAHELRSLDDAMLALRQREAFAALEGPGEATQEVSTLAGMLWEETARREALTAHQRLAQHVARRDH